MQLGICCTYVCGTRVIDIFSRSYYDSLKSFKEGGHEDRERKGHPKSFAFDLARDWLRRFARNHAEPMSDTNTRQLPSCLTKDAVHKLYLEEMGDRPVICKSSFLYDLWKKEFSDILIPKVGEISILISC